MKTDYGYQLHFTHGNKIDHRKTRLEWCVLDLKPDFIDTLKQIGVLPQTSTEGIIEMQKEFNNWNEIERKRIEAGPTTLELELAASHKLLDEQREEQRKQLEK